MSDITVQRLLQAENIIEQETCTFYQDLIEHKNVIKHWYEIPPKRELRVKA